MQLRSILVALALGATSAFMRPASVSRVTARFSVEDKLKEIVAEQLGVEQASITAEASFASDLGADSLDVVEMVMKIEEEFGVELPTSAPRRSRTSATPSASSTTSCKRPEHRSPSPSPEPEAHRI